MGVKFLGLTYQGQQCSPHPPAPGGAPAASGSPSLSRLLQDEELLGHVQNAILQVQGDCEKLNITTGNLIEDHRQKQRDIDVRGRLAGWLGRGGAALPLALCCLSPPTRLAPQVLYQGLEKLEKEKASRAHLDMEIGVVRARPRAAPLCARGDSLATL